MAISDLTGLGRMVANELAKMYGNDYRALREDISKTPVGGGLQRGRSICLSIVLESLDSNILNTDIVRAFLRWTADEIPKEKRDLITVLGKCKGYEERLADNLAGLYGGDYAALKSDMAKVRIAGRVDAEEYPEERGICLALVLNSLEQSSIGRHNVERSLDIIASQKERQLKNG